MKIITTLAGIAAAGTLFAAGALTPALAGSAQSDAFVANARPNVIFLDESSRMALDKSPSRSIRAFAHTEAKQQTIAANSMTAWTQTNTARGEAVAIGGPVAVSPLGPVTDLAFAPLDVATGVTAGLANGVGDVVTGRSVSIDTPLTVTRPASGAPVGSQLLPAGQDNLSRLSAMSGRGFDALYKSTQLDALDQLKTLYSGYAANGDDPALRAIAVGELPKVRARLVELRRL